jgi:hypothetical protein
MSYLSTDLRDRLLEADNCHCAYCYTTEANTGQQMTVDHIKPQAQGGETTLSYTTTDQLPTIRGPTSGMARNSGCPSAEITDCRLPLTTLPLKTL